MPTKMRYSRSVTHKNAKRKMVSDARVELKNGQTKIIVNKSMKNVKNGKNSK